ncbi:hypothetical protein HK405_003830 [Cladochytrium tenue]|nr:hypothetical protein HK405_003830 [Cladochytrium tenue]
MAAVQDTKKEAADAFIVSGGAAPHHYQPTPTTSTPSDFGQPQAQMTTSQDRAAAAAAKRKATLSRVRNIVLVFVLPGILYGAVNDSIGDWQAVLVSAIPVALSFAISLRVGEFDAISPIVLVAYLVTAIIASRYPDQTIPYIKDVVSLGLLGLVFLLSPIIPGWNLIYVMARFGEKDPAKRAAIVERYREKAMYRKGTVILSVIWGFGLLAGSGAIAAVVWASGWSLTAIKWVDLGITLVVVGGLSLVTMLMVKKAENRAKAHAAQAGAV